MDKPNVMTKLESTFYELLAAARAVSNMPLGEGNLARLDRVIQAVDDLTDSPPTQRMPSMPVKAARPVEPKIRALYYDPR
jgi:hypothetical protein